MRKVDSIMESCPLKHEIRAELWAPFVEKLNRKPISYLTLYSPPLMDVKYLHFRKLISIEENVYPDVVGVTYDKDAYAESNETLEYRLGLLLSGNIDHLLDTTSVSPDAKKLIGRFPFDVINLDYTDPLHKANLNVELSPHIKAIETILRKQKHKDKFVLFITTFVDASAYNKDFLKLLQDILDENIAKTPKFADKFKKVFESTTAKEFMGKSYNNFFALSVIKFILKFLAKYSYSLKEGEVKWLVRDNNVHVPERHMLHLAFHIEHFMPPPARTKKDIVGAQQNNVEHKSVTFIRKDFQTYKESTHKDALYKKHGKQIEKFINRTFELDVPEPEE